MWSNRVYGLRKKETSVEKNKQNGHPMEFMDWYDQYESFTFRSMWCGR